MARVINKAQRTVRSSSSSQNRGSAQTRTQAGHGLASFTLINGGDEFLNARDVHDVRTRAKQLLPDAEIVELDAGETDRYSFIEAISPSLLSQVAIVVMTHFESCSDDLFDAICEFIKKAPAVVAHADEDNPQTAEGSCVIASRAQGNRGSGLVTRLKKTKASIVDVPALKHDYERQNFARAQFAKRHRRIRPDALAELVAVMGSRTGELAAMCDQLCDDVEEDPISRENVVAVMDNTAEATGFDVADAAFAGQTATAVVKLRQALTRGAQPVALVGALASKLHQLAIVATVQAGTIDEREAQERHVYGWAIRRLRGQLRGWSSDGLTRAFEALAHADETAKGVGGDPNYELERAVEVICQKGQINV